MIGIGIGLMEVAARSLAAAGPQIGLTATSVLESASTGTTIGTLSVVNGSGSYTFTITADPDSKFALNVDGVTLETAAALDYETATSHSVTIQVDNGVDDPISRVFAISVTNVMEVTLVNLSLDAATVEEGTAAGVTVGAIQNATSGSTVTLTDDAGSRFALSGGNIVTGLVATDYATATSHNITLRETHPDGANSPNDTVIAIAVTEIVAGDTVENQTATFGALTLSGAGGFQIVDTSGDPITNATDAGTGTASGYDLSTGGIITPSSDGALSAQDAATIDISCDQGTATVTLSIDAGDYDVRSEADLLAVMNIIGATSSAVTVFIRDDAELTTWDDDWFNSRTNTGVITIEGRGGQNAKTTIWTASTAVPTANLVSPGNYVFKYLDVFSQFDRTQHNSNSRGLAASGTLRGPVTFSFCDFRGSAWSDIGSGPHFRGLIGGTYDLGDYDLTLTDVTFSNSRRGWSVTMTGGSAGSLIMQRVTGTEISVDYIHLAGAPYSTLVEDVDAHTPATDAYRVFLKPGGYLTGSLSGASDGKQLLSRVQVEFDDAIGSETDILTHAGLSLKRLATGEIDLTVNDTTASQAMALQTAGAVGSYRRVQILISLDTDGINRMSVGVEGANGAFNWEDLSAAGGGETLDLTGTTQVGDGGAVEMYMTNVQVWHGISPDVSDSAVKALFAPVANGMDATTYQRPTTYASPILDIYGTLLDWRAGTNNGTGGDLTASGDAYFDIDHGDMIQLNPQEQLRRVSARRAFLWSGRFDALLGDPRFDYHGFQGLFGEDTGTFTVTMTIANPGVVTDTGHELVEGDPVAFTTTGALPTGVTASRIYYAVNVTTNTYEFSATPGGASIETTGTQSGTHSRRSCYVDCVAESIVTVAKTGYGARFSNGVGCEIIGNTGAVMPGWTSDYNSDTPKVGVYQHNNGGGANNLIADNVSGGAVISAGDDNVTLNNVEARYSGGANDYSVYAGGASMTEPTTLAEAKALFVNAAGGVLDTAVPKVGAFAYSDFDADTTAHPRLSAVDAYTFTDQTDVAVNTLITSNEVEITGLGTNGAVVSVDSGEFRIRDTDQSTVISDWGSADAIITEGQYLTRRKTSSLSNSAPTNQVLSLGGTSDTWTVTTVAGAGATVTNGTFRALLANTANLSAYTFTIPLGTAAADRKLVALSAGVAGGTSNIISVVAHFPTVAGDPTGTAMTENLDYGADNNTAGIWSCDAPTETSCEVVVTFDAAQARAVCAGWTMEKSGTLTMVDSAVSTANPASLDMDIPTGNSYAVALDLFNGVPSGESVTGLTQAGTTLNVGEANYNAIAASDAFTAQDLGRTIQIDPNVVTTINRGLAAVFG